MSDVQIADSQQFRARHQQRGDGPVFQQPGLSENRPVPTRGCTPSVVEAATASRCCVARLNQGELPARVGAGERIEKLAASRRRRTEREADVRELDRNPDPARLHIGLFERPVRRGTDRASARLEPRYPPLSAGEQYRATTAGSTGAPFQIFDVDPHVASAAPARTTTRPALWARLKRSGVAARRFPDARADPRASSTRRARRRAPRPTRSRAITRPSRNMNRSASNRYRSKRARSSGCSHAIARITAARIRRQRSGVRVPDATRRSADGHDAGGGIAIVCRGPLASASRLSIMSTACVFPGQGSQSKGMGADLFDRYPDWTSQADAILGYSIRSCASTTRQPNSSRRNSRSRRSSS